MDRISGLPDDLLVKILSSLPTTKAAVSTCILSKRWQFLWMWLPNLTYSDMSNSSTAIEMLVRFLNKNLPLHRAPVIQSFRLELVRKPVNPEDMNNWVLIVGSRGVRELCISNVFFENENVFPSNVFTCKSLVFLEICGASITDIPPMAHLPALKTLNSSFSSFTEESFQQLLSICPILEYLEVRLELGRHRMKKFSIIVPTLQRLSLCLDPGWELDGYVIDTQSVTYLKLIDYGKSRQFSSFKVMPKLVEAYVEVEDFDVHNCLIESITAVESLTICPQAGYDSFAFNNLQHLKLCVCGSNSLSNVGQFLRDSPNLRVLDISDEEVNCHGGEYWPNYDDQWNKPSLVPECLFSSLQILNWSTSFWSTAEIDVVTYILQNSYDLKKATIRVDRLNNPVTVHIVDNELLLAASKTCEILFIEDGDDSET